MRQNIKRNRSLASFKTNIIMLLIRNQNPKETFTNLVDYKLMRLNERIKAWPLPRTRTLWKLFRTRRWWEHQRSGAAKGQGTVLLMMAEEESRGNGLLLNKSVFIELPLVFTGGRTGSGFARRIGKAFGGFSCEAHLLLGSETYPRVPHCWQEFLKRRLYSYDGRAEYNIKTTI